MTPPLVASPPVRLASGSVHRYRLLIGFALRHVGGWLAILLATVLATATTLLVPLPLKVLIDNVVGHHALPGYIRWLPGSSSQHRLLLYVVVAELLFFALASLLDVILTFLWVRVGQKMVYELAQELFARVQRQTLREHSGRRIGETLQRVMGDSWAVNTVVGELLLTPLKAAITIAGLVAVMAALAPGLTWLACAVAPVMAVTSVALGRRVRQAGRRQRDVQGEMQSLVQQTLAGISVIQAFGAEEVQRGRFDQLTRLALGAQLRVALVSGLNGLGTGAVAAVGTGAILLVGAHQVIAGALTVGGLVMFMSYLPRLQSAFTDFAGIYTKLQSVRASSDRIAEVLDAPVEVGDAVGAVGLERVVGDVVFEGVSFGYEPGRLVLEDVSFRAGVGEVVAVVGATGAGKSTLVSLVPRFVDPDGGRVLLDGYDLRELKLSTVRRSVSLVLQESFLFPFSIAENIAFGRPGASRGEVVAAARAANAHEFISRLPDGYETVVGERGATLSGGERQRVAIARALLKDAPVLILDEPTSSLDARTEALLLEALERLMKGRTTLIIAHRLSTIRNADRIIVLDRGRIVEQGTQRELLRRRGAYRQLHDLQHRSSDG